MLTYLVSNEMKSAIYLAQKFTGRHRNSQFSHPVSEEITERNKQTVTCANMLQNVVEDKLKTVLGGVLCVAFVTFTVCCIPVYIFRFVVICWAKWTRPDLGGILNGLSSILANDYFLETPTRTTIVITKILRGHVTYKEVKNTIQAKWIEASNPDGTLVYEKFQQYPVRWMGFTFWKWCHDTFSLDRHVHQLFDKDTLVTEEQLNESMEKILNSQHPKRQSPWELFVVENYKNSKSILTNDDGEAYSAVVLKVHHCLADGFSLRQAIVEGLAGHCLTNMLPPQARYQKKSWKQKLKNFLGFPFVAFYELSYFLSHCLRSSPWKIADVNKEWYQIYECTDPFPIATVKDIKNKMGVTFTSVLLSAISSAVSQSPPKAVCNTVQISGSPSRDPLVFLSALPVIRGQRIDLTNNATAAVFVLPRNSCKSPSERLKVVHEVLEITQFSVVPFVAQYICNLVGSLCYPLIKLFSNNKMIQIGLTNFPGVPLNLELYGKPCLDAQFIAGCLEGETGLAVSVLSHGQHIRVGVCAEQGLLSKQQLRQFVQYITAEIHTLRDIAIKME